MTSLSGDHGNPVPILSKPSGQLPGEAGYYPMQPCIRTWQTPSAVKAAVWSQSSWSKGSSMVTMGKSVVNLVYIFFSSSLPACTHKQVL